MQISGAMPAPTSRIPMNLKTSSTINVMCAAGAAFLLAGCFGSEDPNTVFQNVYAQRYEYWTAQGVDPKTAKTLASDEAQRARSDAITPPEMRGGAPQAGMVLARFSEPATPSVAPSCPTTVHGH
jgi:hypothetical protein